MGVNTGRFSLGRFPGPVKSIGATSPQDQTVGLNGQSWADLPPALSSCVQGPGKGLERQTTGRPCGLISLPTLNFSPCKMGTVEPALPLPGVWGISNWIACVKARCKW